MITPTHLSPSAAPMGLEVVGRSLSPMHKQPSFLAALAKQVKPHQLPNLFGDLLGEWLACFTDEQLQEAYGGKIAPSELRSRGLQNGKGGLEGIEDDKAGTHLSDRPIHEQRDRWLKTPPDQRGVLEPMMSEGAVQVVHGLMQRDDFYSEIDPFREKPEGAPTPGNASGSAVEAAIDRMTRYSER